MRGRVTTRTLDSHAGRFNPSLPVPGCCRCPTTRIMDMTFTVSFICLHQLCVAALLPSGCPSPACPSRARTDQCMPADFRCQAFSNRLQTRGEQVGRRRTATPCSRLLESAGAAGSPRPPARIPATSKWRPSAAAAWQPGTRLGLLPDAAGRLPTQQAPAGAAAPPLHRCPLRADVPSGPPPPALLAAPMPVPL